MHSIGSAHAEVRSRRRETSLASTTDRILLINGLPAMSASPRLPFDCRTKTSVIHVEVGY